MTFLIQLRPFVRLYLHYFATNFPRVGLWFFFREDNRPISQTRLISKHTLRSANTLTTRSTRCRVLTRGLRAVVVCSAREHEIPQTTALSPTVPGSPSEVFCERMKWLGKHLSMLNRGLAQRTMPQSLRLNKQAEARPVHHADTLTADRVHSRTP